MSAATSELPPKRLRSERAESIVHLVVASVVVADLGILTLGAATQFSELQEASVDILFWTMAVAIVGLAAIPSESGPQLGLDMPVLLAVGYLLGPIAAGIVAFVGYTDLREFSRAIPLERALFNRAQTSLSVISATFAFGALDVELELTPGAFLAVLLAVGVDTVLNYGLVATVMALSDRVRPSASLSRMRLGPAIEFALTYGAFGLLSLVLAVTYRAEGPWALLVLALPLLLARQALGKSQKLERASRRIAIQEEALNRASASVLKERKDERLAIAAGLHDDVLPPLFKVHLMGQVLRQELARGQLLALEDDLPELLRATDEASDRLRRLISDLRRSPLGTRGLAHTLRLLVRQLEADSRVHMSAEIEDVSGTPVVELLAYQIAAEGLRNSIRHSNASSIRVSLAREGGDIRLVVEDDGCGFDPRGVREDEHFGLALMHERAELIGGLIQVDSREGEGTRIVARLPSTETQP
jgi:two-component system sensor histidine kinase DegS